MFKKRFVFTLLLFFVSASAAQASWFDATPTSGVNDIATALAQPDLSIDGYDLSTEELKQFYATRSYKAAWDTRTNFPALRAFLLSVTAFADYHGVNTDDYPAATIEKLLAESASDANENAKNLRSLKVELLVSEHLLRLAHTMHGDDIDLADIYPGWNFEREPIDIVDGLSKAVGDSHISEFITGLAPSNPAYIFLLDQLQHYRAMQKAGGWPIVSSGGVLRPHDHSARVAEIRKRLVAESYAASTTLSPDQSSFYDDDLEKSVEDYQSHNGLKADGHIGDKTIVAMNISIAKRINQIIANMERWRHMPQSFPATRVVVNIPDTTLDVFKDDKLYYHGIVIDGRPDRKTPFIQSAIRSIIFNPAWHVPISIARKDILPKLRKDPHYLEKLGFVINGSADDPHGEDIDWRSIHENAFNFQLRQSPGDMNSLGRLKFDFDNDFSVYLHGTPHQELFDKAERNLSSGCVRLRDPVKFASIVLEHNTGDWTEDKIAAEVDKDKTRWLKLEQKLPLYILYWTVFSGDDGKMNFRNDVYDYDSFLLEELKGK